MELYQFAKKAFKEDNESVICVLGEKDNVIVKFSSFYVDMLDDCLTFSDVVESMKVIRNAHPVYYVVLRFLSHGGTEQNG